ncbi:MAG: flippase-like domain-containing protein [Armatimonadetes bacterium]|nr:flippase-like domain-containing protein [Armatimonadota bacterium]
MSDHEQQSGSTDSAVLDGPDVEEQTFAPRLSGRRLILLVLIFVALCVLAMAFIGEREAWAALRAASPGPVLLACGVMTAGWMAWALLYQSLLSGQRKPQSLRELFLLVLGGLAAARVLPSAGASGAAVRFYFWRRRGVEPEEIVTTLVASEAAFYTGLLFILWGGLTYLWAHTRVPRALLTAAMVASVAVAVAFVVVLAALVRKPNDASLLHRLTGFINRIGMRLLKRPFLGVEQMGELLTGIASSIQQLRSHPGSALLAVVCAGAWWAANFLALHLVFLGFGVQVPWGTLIVAYVLGALTSSLAGFVAGLGATEASMIGVLALLGVPAKETTMAVLAFRLIEFWLPIPLGIWSLHSLWRRSKL